MSPSTFLEFNRTHPAPDDLRDLSLVSIPPETRPCPGIRYSSRDMREIPNSFTIRAPDRYEGSKVVGATLHELPGTQPNSPMIVPLPYPGIS